MKKRVSKVLCLLLVAILAIAVVGCSPTEPTNTAGTSTAPAASKEPADATIEPAAEPVTLKFWDMAWGNADTYPVLAEGLTKQYTEEVSPNVTINYTNLPWSNWFETFSTAVATNDAPDFSTGGGFMPFQFAAMGEAADLQWIVDEWKKEGTDTDFEAGALDYWRFKDVQVSFPWNYDPRISIIRQDWLDELNLEMPTSWDELFDVAKAFSGKGSDIYGIVFGTNNAAGPFMNFATMNGGMLYDKDANANMVTENNLETMKFFRKLKDEGLLPEGVENYSGDDVLKLFMSEKVGIAIGGSSLIRDAHQGGLTETTIPLPYSSPSGIQKYQNCLNGFMAYAQKDELHQTESKKFLKWYSENNLILYTEGQMNPYPTRLSFYEADIFKNGSYQKLVVNNVLPNAAPLAYPISNAMPSTSYAEGQKYDMIVMQSALLETEAKWTETLERLNADLQATIDSQDK